LGAGIGALDAAEASACGGASVAIALGLEYARWARDGAGDNAEMTEELVAILNGIVDFQTVEAGRFADYCYRRFTWSL
jgi:hypothetical protein